MISDFSKSHFPNEASLLLIEIIISVLNIDHTVDPLFFHSLIWLARTNCVELVHFPQKPEGLFQVCGKTTKKSSSIYLSSDFVNLPLSESPSEVPL